MPAFLHAANSYCPDAMERDMKKSILVILLTALWFFLSAPHVSAYITGSGFLCVDGVGAASLGADLQAALDFVTENPDYEVRLVNGTFSIPGSSHFNITTAIPQTISGGWTLDCSSQTADPQLTILSGGADQNYLSGGVLSVVIDDNNSPATFSISNLSVRNGKTRYGDGGGIFFEHNGTASLLATIHIANVIVESNLSDYWGAGIAISEYKTAEGTNVVITDSVIQNNGGTIINHDPWETPSPGPAGISINTKEPSPGVEVEILRCKILNNSADSSGGGLYINSGASNTTLVNNVIAGNSVDNDNGGGIYIKNDAGGIVTLVNNTITQNSAKSGHNGGGIYALLDNSASELNIYNNIIYNNTAGGTGDDLHIDNLVAEAVNLFNNDLNTTMPAGMFVAIQTNFTSSDNLNNINPQFTTSNDYHLSATSPLINSGNNDAPGLPPGDIEGKSRLMGCHVDMGAYEYQTVLFNDNGTTRFTSCGVGECGAVGFETCLDGEWLDNTCMPGTPTTEICDNLDNDCDNFIDEALTRSSTCGIGQCAAAGTETCVAGSWGNDTCSPGTPTAETCDNLDNDCDGTIDEGLTRGTSCGVGQCAAAGNETCTAGSWGNDTCSPGTPTAETCDNLDNDCDGTTDENLTRPSVCGVGQCAAAGTETCTAGSWGNDTCSPDTPTAETCDNLDNDCDGTIDEGLTRGTSCGVGQCAAAGTEICTAGSWGNDTCSPGTPATETCDNLDNDCDGATDEELTRDTSCGVGICTGNTGMETCSAGNWINDTCDPLAGAVAETCDGTLDEDCDGIIDNGCDCTDGESRNCGSDTGECNFGTQTCVSGAWSAECIGGTGPTTEICDNLDNDCDNAIDENLTRPSTCGVGQCAAAGIETCSAGIWDNDTCLPGTPTAETCDNLDNDCDNVIDDDLTRETTCGVGGCAVSVIETCTAGVWDGDACLPSTPTAETCDNLDNDCDGTIDENLTRPSTCGVGQCAAAGTETCTAGTWDNDTCLPGTPTAEICDNLDNNCDGATDEGLIRDTTCGVGQCGAAGIETCSAGTWGNDACTPGTPTAETCDNLDNDCDGAIDENLTKPTTCGIGQCTASGSETCSAGAWLNNTCTPGEPALIETCDNLDNDCDGATDEGLTRDTTCGVGQCVSAGMETCSAGTWGNDTCIPGTPTAETCDNLDNDCDGAIDENLTKPTTCGIGECEAFGVEICTVGTWGNDTCKPATPNAETCDNLDNDCDDAVDENLIQSTSCGIGACSDNTGEETCTAGVWGGDTCDPLAGATIETCDNIDNDCDGTIDENLTRQSSCGVGACSGNVGEETCSAGVWGSDTCDPMAGATSETCDNNDNDCDGTIDENLTRQSSCGIGQCAAAGIETCSAGTWGNDTCSPGSPVPEICDNIDNDCDGTTDEELTRDTSCGVGQCTAAGIETCSAGTWINDTCSPGPPVPEICDNIDNDCDGATDEGLTRTSATTCGLGECEAFGIETCSAGEWGNETCTPGTPSIELCDGMLDENCDGRVDEDCTCMQGDVNGNTLIDLQDAILALKIMAGQTPAAAVCRQAGLTSDLTIGSREVLFILQKISGIR